jgi:hypothetical protein
MKENWLPINREDIGINGQFRIYIPDSKKMIQLLPLMAMKPLHL